MQKTILVAGRRFTLTTLGKEGGVETARAEMEIKDLGTVQVIVTRQDPDRYKDLADFLATPRTATEVQKRFSLKTWSAAGRMIDAAKAAGVKIHIRKSEPATGRMGRRPYLFCTDPSLFEQRQMELVPHPRATPSEILPQVVEGLMTALERLTARLELLERQPMPPPMSIMPGPALSPGH